MPLETSFTDITNRLDITPATVDRQYDKSRGRGRSIKKLSETFVFPPFTLNAAFPDDLMQGGLLIAQCNYTAPGAFKLLKTDIPYSNYEYCAPSICIRYRVGTTVYRYRLPYNDSVIEALVVDNTRVQAPLYNKQRIEANFSIELWMPNVWLSGFIDLPELTFITNRLTLPNNATELGTSFDVSQALMRYELEVALPEAIPTDYPAGSTWLTN